MVVVSVPLGFYHVELPEEETPYAMWLRGELDDYLHLAELFSSEVIDGEIVVSRARLLEQDRIVQTLILAFDKARALDETHSWRCSSAGLDLVRIEAGHIPDLMILDHRLYVEASREHRIVSDHIEMVVEVTSPSNAGGDRRPAKASAKLNKWRGYARVGVPYYLLVDRDPQRVCITLYSIPDSVTGAYLQEESWKFGETVRLPEHFGVTIPTDEWLPWKSE